LQQYLNWHRNEEATKDEREDYESRLRIARRSIQENEFFHGINGDNIIGPNSSSRASTELPNEIMNNPKFSLYYRHKLALRERSEKWIEDQANKQLQYDAETAAKWQYKQEVWDAKVKAKEAADAAAASAAFVAPKNARKKVGAKKTKKKKKIKKSGPGSYDFDEPHFWSHATPINPGTKNLWSKTWIYQDIYQGRQKYVKLKDKQKTSDQKNKNAKKDSDQSSSSSDYSEDEEEEYVNENEALLKKDYISHWVNSLKVNVGGMGPPDETGQPSRGVSTFGHLDIPVNPYAGAEVGPYNSLPRPKQEVKPTGYSHGLGGFPNNYFSMQRSITDKAHYNDTYGAFTRQMPDAYYDYRNNFFGKNVSSSILSSKIQHIRDSDCSDDKKREQLVAVIRKYGKTSEEGMNTKFEQSPYGVQLPLAHTEEGQLTCSAGCTPGGRQLVITMEDINPIAAAQKNKILDYRKEIDPNWERTAHVERDFDRQHALTQLQRYPQFNSGDDVYAYNCTYLEYLTIKSGKKKSKKKATNDTVITLEGMVEADKYADVDLNDMFKKTNGNKIRGNSVENIEKAEDNGTNLHDEARVEEASGRPSLEEPSVLTIDIPSELRLNLSPASPPSPAAVSDIKAMVAGVCNVPTTAVTVHISEEIKPHEPKFDELSNCVAPPATNEPVVSYDALENLAPPSSTSIIESTNEEVLSIIRETGGSLSSKHAVSTKASQKKKAVTKRKALSKKDKKPTIRELMLKDDRTSRQKQLSEERQRNVKTLRTLPNGDGISALTDAKLDGVLANIGLGIGGSTLGVGIYKTLAPDLDIDTVKDSNDDSRNLSYYPVSTDDTVNKNIASTSPLVISAASEECKIGDQEMSTEVDAKVLVPCPPTTTVPSAARSNNTNGHTLCKGHRSIGVPSFRAIRHADKRQSVDARVSSTESLCGHWEALAHVDPSQYGFHSAPGNQKTFDGAARGYSAARVFEETMTGNIEGKKSTEKSDSSVVGETKDSFDYMNAVENIGGDLYSKNMVKRRQTCSLLGAVVYD
jgi:hypothetical protein